MQRDLQFDIVRVLATFWIVGVWHLVDDLANREIYALGHQYGYITTYSLATFMFISGYFLSKYKFCDKEEIYTFYKKRFIRFFPLFVLSAYTLMLKGMNPGYTKMILTITGLSSYIGYQPYTVWFISMLFSFYMVTPFISNGLNKIGDNKINKLLVVVVVSILFIFLLSCTSLDYDSRLSYTMPFYAFGLVLGRDVTFKKMTTKWYTLAISLIVCILCRIFGICNDKFLQIDVVFGILALLSVSYWLQFLCIGRFIKFLSYISMCMYLFHRQVFYVVKDLIFQQDKVSVYQAYLIMLPCSIIVAYIIQKGYDILIKKISTK